MKKKRRNPYNIDDVMQRDDCAYDEAVATINNLKSKTSGSLESFISRYGKAEGTNRYNDFCKKSANTQEKFKSKYGSDWKIEWDKYLLSKDSMSKEFHKKKYGKDWEVYYENRLKSVAVGLNDFILRYGEVLGTSKFNEMNKSRSYSCSTQGLIETYGIDEALRINKSKSLPGELNPMFGKPSPVGSGCGISGWFEGNYFRSLFELSFMVYAKNSNIDIKSAETKEYRVPYILDGVDRTYCPDFVINNKTVVEIKPKGLLNIPENQAKFEAAGKKYNEDFIVLTEQDFPVLKNLKELKQIYEIKLTDNSRKRYENYKH